MSIKKTFLVTNDAFMPTTGNDCLSEYATEKLAMTEAVRCVKEDCAGEVYIWRLAKVVSMSEPEVEFVS